tara:strand:- start:1480 stop:6105 length:4626 start_codon:yes stop_codon:yes gene_type:complete
MSLKLVVPAALALPKNDSAVTTHFGTDFASRITFNRAPQGMAKPYMTLVVGAVDYDPTVDESIASAVYRIDYLLYTDTAELGLTIMEELRDAIRTATHDDFDIRLLDEDYFVDVDGVHRITLSSTWRETVTRSTRSFANVIDGDGTSHQVTTGHTYTCLALPNDPLFADDYPDVEAIYSLRQMRRQYRGSAIRVRRGGDNAELGIGFDNDGTLDTRALEAFVTATGDNTAFVKIWYDQTGNNNHLTQEDMSKQPQIVASGSVLLEGGKPTVKFDGVNDDLRNGDESIMNGSELTIVTVAKPTEDFSDYEESLVQRTILDQSGTSNGAEFKSVDANQKVTVLSRFDGTAVELNDNVSRLNQRSLYFANYKSGESKLSVNTSEVSTSATSFTAGGNTGVTFSLGSDGAGNTSFYKGNMQEVIVFNTEQTSSKVGIESDLQQYYSVYTPISSGLLDTHSNAHVGFSLRQLDVNYTGPCLEVRRDSDNTTKDIGFLVDGSLNVAQLLDFCGTGDGFVRTWHDQSGNGYDAVQNTHDIQPRIVKDGAVEKNERGALCVNFLEGLTGVSAQGPRFEDIGPDIDTSPHTAFGVITGHDAVEETGRRSIYSFGPAPVYRQFEVTLWETKLIQAFIGDGSNYASVAPFGYVHDSRSHISTSRYDAVNFNLRIDNIERIDYSITKEVSGSLNLASRNGANMRITEFILYPSIKSDSDCDTIEDNMNDYWNVWTPFTTGILDTYGSASFAYGLRRLNSAYTGPLVEIRPSTANTQIDIGTTPDGLLDYSYLRQAAASQDAFVRTWYDQSGNGNDLVQTDSTLQAKIYDGATERSLRDEDNRVYMDCTSAQYVSVVDVDQPFTAAVTLNQGGTERIFQDGGFFWSPTGYYHQRFFAGSPGVQIIGTSDFVEGSKHVVSVMADGADTVLHYDGVQDATGNPGLGGVEDGTTLFTQGGTPPISNNGTDRAYEMIVWGSDQLANLQSIHQDMAEGYDVSGHVRPMDSIGPAQNAVGAYGLRMLNSSWGGPCIRVRRDDNEQKDIYFDKLGNVDIKTLTDFVGSGDGRVVKWYDQSGRNNHGVQEDTLTRQPYIMIDGVVQRSGHKPAIMFKQSDGSRMVFTSDDFINQSHLDTYMVTDTTDDVFAHWIGRESSGLYSFIAEQGDSSYPHNIHGGYGNPSLYVNKSQQATGTGVPSTNWVTRDDIHDYISGRKLQVYEGAETTIASGSDPHWPEFLLEGYSANDSAGLNYEGKIGEIYLFNQDNSSNRSALEDHMNRYFGVWRTFQGAIVPIASNDNAAAAYSLRKIRSGWAGAAVELRRENGDTQDIGFDVEGNFDIGAAMIFCDGGAGTVVRWYDQTGNNRHAIASTSAGGSISEARQPTLVDDTGRVFTDSNGRARIRFNGVDDGLSYDSTVFNLNSVSSFVVGEFVNQNSGQMMFGLSGPSDRFYNTYMHENKFKYGYGGTLTTQADANTNLNLHTHIAGSTLGNAEAFLNGSSVGTQTLVNASANSSSGIGMQSNSFFANCHIQEVILYDNDQSANRTTIEGNINDYYDIYD